MFCRSFGWFICISAAVAANYGDTGSVTDSPTVEPVDLASLLDAGDRAVVTLVAGDTQLAAHKAVLATRSPLFAANFGHDTLEASGGRLSIADVEGPVLRQLVSYLYTLKAPQLPSMAPQLLAAADKYGVPGLKADLEQQVAAQLSVENAAATAVLAVRHSAKRLRQAAIAFIKDNFLPVVATRGWSEAMRSQPVDFNEVIQLLTQAVAETSVPATTESSTAPTTEMRSRTPVAAVTTTAAPTATTESAAVSRLRSLTDEEKGRRLIQAAKEGAVGELRSLLAAGADVGARDGDRWTALHWAAARGHAEAASCLLGNGAQVDARNSAQETPLFRAVYHGHKAVARLLLASSAYQSARNKDGWTPLHIAAYFGHAELAAALLEAGASRRAKTDYGQTPLGAAREEKHQQLVDMLSRI